MFGQSVLFALSTVRFLAWDGRYASSPGVTGALSHLIVFTCRDRRRYLDDIQHHVLLADYKEERLPDAFCVCSQQKVLDLSYCS